MKRNVIYLLLLLWPGMASLRAQSSLNVRYMINYDESTKTFTAWVVPNYNTPNENNADPEEKGATAQFTLKVPKGFTIGNIRDIRGGWDKQPIRFGSEEIILKAGADTRYEYYVIGKTPVETNYGVFKQSEPVALFSFSGMGGSPSEVSVLEGNDPFIELADQLLALNVRNSFYSRSGQHRSMMSIPGEQFTAPAKIRDILTELAKKAEAAINSANLEFSPEMQLIAYPNPVVSRLKVHFFSMKEKEKIDIELIDMEGDVRIRTNFVATYGVNKLEIPVDELITGVFLLRMKLENEIVNRKILKINEGY